MSIFDYFLSYTFYFKAKVQGFILLRNTYANYFRILLDILRKRYPIEAVFRENKKTVLLTPSQVFFIGSLKDRKGFRYDIANDLLTISLRLLPHTANSEPKRTHVKLYGCANNGDILSVFINNEYSFLPVGGKTVIDIGANIGDSSIYFFLCGASKVIGLEPFPNNFELAKKNIESNDLSDSIDLIIGGLAENTSYISIGPDQTGDSVSRFRSFKEGIKIPLMTLDDILNENKIVPTECILKMDCEGCEYDTIIPASPRTLQMFSHIQIEYHNGYKNLKEKLEQSGFAVSFTRPKAWKGEYFGYIYAHRINEAA